MLAILCWLNGRIEKDNSHKYFHLYSIFTMGEALCATIPNFRDKLVKLIVI